MIKPELLSPAGDLEKAYTAFNFGADAIYIGAKAYSLRARAGNFELNELEEIINYAHKNNKKVYIVMNVMCHNALVNDFNNFLDKVIKLKPDAFIVADPFIIYSIKIRYPYAEIHISTQQSICNSKSALFFKKQGATRVVTARELSYKDLKDITSNLKEKMEIEYFIHGAVCISYSGQCMMSNNFSLRDANVGGCAQSCRWVWTLYDEKQIYSNQFSMSAKDMCQIKNINKLLKLDINSYKVEGRMKSVHYIATVINCYRKLIDICLKNKYTDEIGMYYYNEINKAANRITSIAWFDGKPKRDEMLYHEELRELNQNFIFIISKEINETTYEVLAKNNFSKNEKIEIFGPTHDLIEIKIDSIFDSDNNELDIIKTPMRYYILKLSKKYELKKNDIARSTK